MWTGHAQVLNLDALPGKLAIVGGGYIALEFAGIYNNFGTEVHVLWRQARPAHKQACNCRRQSCCICDNPAGCMH